MAGVDGNPEDYRTVAKVNMPSARSTTPATSSMALFHGFSPYSSALLLLLSTYGISANLEIMPFITIAVPWLKSRNMFAL